MTPTPDAPKPNKTSPAQLAAVKRWRMKNPAKARALRRLASRRFRKEHPEKVAEYQRRYREKNHDKLRALQNAWADRNREWKRARDRDYWRRNGPRLRALQNARLKARRERTAKGS